MPRSRAVLGGLTTLVLALPAAADAATLQTDRLCYVESQEMTVAGAGWAPGSAWSVETDQIFQSGVADPAGNFATTALAAPIVADITTRPRTFTLSGKQDGTEVATTTFKVVNFLVQPRDPTGDPRRSTSWGFSGFAPGKRIYFHVRRGTKTYTTKAGRGDSACGTLRTRLKRLPGVPASRIRDGKYGVFVDNRRRFSKGGLQYRARITIAKTFS